MSAPAEHFESVERQHQAAELGMWVFLATELMFFGPLFLGYAYGRWAFPEGFAAASQHTDVLIGTVNTAILLTSSLFMALGVRAVQLKQRGPTRVFLACAAVLGSVFLALKGLEYRHEWQEHLVPWLDFRFEPVHQHAAALFYFLYFGMTGLHAIHLTIGIAVVGVFVLRLARQPLADLQNSVEMGALYWHFVDGIWVVLYPILYLLERHG
ncbi:MAG: cytochrome c oxidase subunit 3 [Steroidobacteraceae bacterium]